MFVVQSLNHARPFATSWTAAYPASLSFPISWSLLILMSIESVMPSNHLVFCRFLLLLPPTFPASGLFQWVSSSPRCLVEVEKTNLMTLFLLLLQTYVIVNEQVGTALCLRFFYPLYPSSTSLFTSIHPCCYLSTLLPFYLSTLFYPSNGQAYLLIF